MEGFATPTRTVSCTDHSGHSKPPMSPSGTAAKWTKKGDWIEPMKDEVGR
jgi:branched-chain amino acid transport system substrate-binding protein